jgi:hypothetical protein
MKNWQTTVAGIGSAVFALLTVLAAAPHETGVQHLPEAWRPKIITAGVIASFVLRVWQAVASADRAASDAGVKRNP